MDDSIICAQNLALAIVKQASDDYIRAVRYQMKTIGHIARTQDDLTKEDKRKRYSQSKMYKAICHIEDCEWFFDEIVMTTSYKPGEITSILRDYATEKLHLTVKQKLYAY